MSNHKKLKKFL